MAEARLETILPRLFFMSMSFVRPPTVFSLLPRSTSAFASLPLAILLARLAFITFTDFIAFIDFMVFGRAMVVSAGGARVGWMQAVGRLADIRADPITCAK